MYEREGLLRPARTEGNTRLYDTDTIERLEIILTLTRHLGVNLAGVEVILHMKQRMEKMQGEVQKMLRDAARGGREPAPGDRPHPRPGPDPGPPLRRPPGPTSGSRIAPACCFRPPALLLPRLPLSCAIECRAF